MSYSQISYEVFEGTQAVGSACGYFAVNGKQLFLSAAHVFEEGKTYSVKLGERFVSVSRTYRPPASEGGSSASSTECSIDPLSFELEERCDDAVCADRFVSCEEVCEGQFVAVHSPGLKKMNYIDGKVCAIQPGHFNVSLPLPKSFSGAPCFTGDGKLVGIACSEEIFDKSSASSMHTPPTGNAIVDAFVHVGIVLDTVIGNSQRVACFAPISNALDRAAALAKV